LEQVLLPSPFASNGQTCEDIRKHSPGARRPRGVRLAKRRRRSIRAEKSHWTSKRLRRCRASALPSALAALRSRGRGLHRSWRGGSRGAVSERAAPRGERSQRYIPQSAVRPTVVV